METMSLLTHGLKQPLTIISQLLWPRRPDKALARVSSRSCDLGWAGALCYGRFDCGRLCFHRHVSAEPRWQKLVPLGLLKWGPPFLAHWRMQAALRCCIFKPYGFLLIQSQMGERCPSTTDIALSRRWHLIPSGTAYWPQEMLRSHPSSWGGESHKNVSGGRANGGHIRSCLEILTVMFESYEYKNFSKVLASSNVFHEVQFCYFFLARWEGSLLAKYIFVLLAWFS